MVIRSVILLCSANNFFVYEKSHVSKISKCLTSKLILLVTLVEEFGGGHFLPQQPQKLCFLVSSHQNILEYRILFQRSCGVKILVLIFGIDNAPAFVGSIFELNKNGQN